MFSAIDRIRCILLLDFDAAVWRGDTGWCSGTGRFVIDWVLVGFRDDTKPGVERRANYMIGGKMIEIASCLTPFCSKSSTWILGHGCSLIIVVDIRSPRPPA